MTVEPDDEHKLIDPTKPFLMSAMVTQAGRPDRIDFAAELPLMAVDEETLIAQIKRQARQCGGRYYIFEVRPVRRLTQSTNKLVG